MPDTDTTAKAKAAPKPRRGGRRGRPAGTKTKTAPTVNATAAPCPQCGSTNHEVLRKLPDQPHIGEFQGQPYTCIQRRRCRCVACGQHFMRIDRPYDPSASSGASPGV